MEQLVNGAGATAVRPVEDQHLKVTLGHPCHLGGAGRAAVGKREAGNCHTDAALRLNENRVVDETVGRWQPGGRRGRCLRGRLLGLRLRGRLCRRWLWVAIASGEGRGVTWHRGSVSFSFAILACIDL